MKILSMNKQEIIEVNGSKVFIEDGKVKTVFSEKIQNTGRMNPEELRNLLHASIKMHRRLLESNFITKEN